MKRRIFSLFLILAILGTMFVPFAAAAETGLETLKETYLSADQYYYNQLSPDHKAAWDFVIANVLNYPDQVESGSPNRKMQALSRMIAADNPRIFWMNEIYPNSGKIYHDTGKTLTYSLPLKGDGSTGESLTPAEFHALQETFLSAIQNDAAEIRTGTLYIGNFTAANGQIIKAIAVDKGCAVSETASHTVAHIHGFSTDWTEDDTYHWHTCSGCTEISGKAEHTWNNGEITLEATDTTSGIKTFTCSICQATKTEPIPTTSGIIASGECGAQGDNLIWTLNSNGVLTISGNGEMVETNYPWDSHRSAIKEIIFSSGVTSIGKSAFSGCVQLTNVDIQGNSIHVGDYAFWGCSSLPDIHLPAGTYIGSGSFVGCSSLEEISIDPNSASYMSKDGVLYNKLSTTLILYPAGKPGDSFAVPVGITSIYDYAFYGAQNLKSVTLPDGVTSIGMRAFAECRSLAQINIPAGVVTVANEAFMNSGLTSIELPAGLPAVGLNAFSGCKNLVRAVLPEGMRVINNYMFASCSSLEEVNIPDSVTSISHSAFAYCRSLRNIVIPDGVTDIGSYAFTDCIISDIVIPDSVTTMGVEAFMRCGSTHAVISKNLTEIPRNTFDGCRSLTTVVIPSSVVTISNAAFDVTQGGNAIGSKLSDVYYSGTQQQWEQIAIGERNVALTSANLHFIHFVSYSANGGTGRMVDNLMEDGSSFTLPACEFTGPDNQAFKAWRIDGTEYAPGDIIAVTADTVVTALWEKTSVPPVVPDTYTVSYNANGGAGTMVDETVNEGAAYTLPICGFTAPSGKAFKAWAIDGTEYAPGAVYTVTSNTTVTAVWQDSSAPAQQVYTITASAGTNGRIAPSGSVQVSKGESKSFQMIPNSGYYVARVVVDGAAQNMDQMNYYGEAPGSLMNHYSAAPDRIVCYRFENVEANHTISVDFAKAGEDANGTQSGNGSSGGSGNTGGSSSYSITIPSRVTGGTVKVTPSRAEKGDTVTITVMPDSGYVLDYLIVTDNRGNRLDLTDKGNGKYTFTMPGSKVTIDVAFRRNSSQPSDTVFSDVPTGYWAKDAIEWASANGYMNGTTTTTFNPDGSTTRQQMWMILARLSGQNPASMAEARAWAMSNGISDGINGANAMTRQQMVTFLYRYCGMMGYSISGSGNLTQFPDHYNVADYAKEALAWAVGNGIINGTADGRLNPGGTATRAQFAVILQRFCENIVGL